jgi:hypothetical protein
MSRIQDITITNTPIIMGIMATVFTRLLGLATVTKIMAAIGVDILLMDGIGDMAAIEEGTETAGIKAMAVIAAGVFMAASIDKNAEIIT